MTEIPMVTIFVTAYNNEKTIKKTLESLIHQTYQNFEIIISDNGSSDDTVKIVKSFSDPRIFVRSNVKKIVSDKSYIGFYDNCNGCIFSGLAQGEYIAFYHADDIYKKDILQKEIEFLLQNPSAKAVFTMGEIINATDDIIGHHKIPKELQSKKNYNFKEIFNNILIHGNTFLLTPTFMAKKTIFNELGPFANEGEFGTSADLEMWLRILEKYQIGILKEKLIWRRIDGGGKSYNTLRTSRADFFKLMDYYLIDKKYTATVSKQELRQYEYQKDFDNTLCAMNFLIKGHVIEAKKIINDSFRVNYFLAFFENMTPLRAKVIILKIILFFGINLGLGKILGKTFGKII